MLVIYFTLLVLYAFPLLKMGFAFAKTQTVNTIEPVLEIPVSIIVCARNEAQNITACLSSILHQHYNTQLIELILIDDASSDDTMALANKVLLNSGITYKITRNETRLGKKKSLSSAIASAKHELVITRDADTQCGPQWLASIVNCYQTAKADFIICPIDITEKKGLLNAMQRIENQILLMISGGSAIAGRAFLCSGANLAFKKTLFLETGGYQSHINIASGDDVLFLADVRKKTKAKIVFLKQHEAVVNTIAMDNMPNLLEQKIRWAAKTVYHPDLYSRYLAAVISACNLFFILAFVQMLLFQHWHLLLFVIAKCGVDILLLFLSAEFMRNKQLFWYGLPVALLYPFYSTAITVATFVYQPRWK